MRVLNFGSLNIDYVYALPHFVQAGETLQATAYQKNTGGKGLNQSVALARAGVPVCHAGMIGADGLFLKEFLAAEGVETAYIAELDQPTGHAIIQVDENGGNCILVYAGSNGGLTESFARRVFADFGPEDYLLVQNEVAGLALLLRLAKERGMKVILNPSPINDELLRADLSAVDYFIMNEVEGAALTGREDPIEILDEMTRRYPRAAMVLTLGGKGAYFSNGTIHAFEEARRVQVVDTTAAGDTFTGFFFAALLTGAAPAEALSRATAAAAHAVSVAGAACSIPHAADLPV